VIYSLVLVIYKYRYGERFSHHEVKISHSTVNPAIYHKPDFEVQGPKTGWQLRGFLNIFCCFISISVQY
jgi:hypothetical protein